MAYSLINNIAAAMPLTVQDWRAPVFHEERYNYLRHQSSEIVEIEIYIYIHFLRFFELPLKKMNSLLTHQFSRSTPLLNEKFSGVVGARS